MSSWLSIVAQFIIGFVQVRVMLRLARNRRVRTASALGNGVLVAPHQTERLSPKRW